MCRHKQDDSKACVWSHRLFYWISKENIMIGEIYWLQSKSDIAHPYVIIQEMDDEVVLCALTTNMKKLTILGNILLDVGEANLPKPSIVEVGKIATVHKNQLGDYIGTLNEKRMNQIILGVRFMRQSYFRDI